jgi:segregation and condensation protein A
MAVASEVSKEFEGTGRAFKTPSFEGPLDLLLFLIQKSKINIYDIPIALITEQFLDYLHSSKDDYDLNSISDFYKMAADLLYIKSRMLLPVDIDFDEEYDDPRQELVERLLEYQKFRRYADLLESGIGQGDLFIERKKSSFMIPFEDQELFENVNVLQLLETYSNIMAKISPTKIFNVYEEVTVNEKLALMNEMFETVDMIRIEDIIIHLNQPLHIICSFLAILEGCKYKMITIVQAIAFDTIIIRKRDENYSIDGSNADEIDDMYEESIKKGIYKEKEISQTAECDNYSIKKEKEYDDLDKTIHKEIEIPIIEVTKEEKITESIIETEKENITEVQEIHSKLPSKSLQNIEEVDGLNDNLVGFGEFEEIDLGDED